VIKLVFQAFVFSNATCNRYDEENAKMRGALGSAIVTEKPNVKWDDVAGLGAGNEDSWASHLCTSHIYAAFNCVLSCFFVFSHITADDLTARPRYSLNPKP
jgi:hypothetical protein